MRCEEYELQQIHHQIARRRAERAGDRVEQSLQNKNSLELTLNPTLKKERDFIESTLKPPLLFQREGDGLARRRAFQPAGGG